MGQSDLSTELGSEDALVGLAGRVAERWLAGGLDTLVAGLTGELGAGKTTWVRGMLRGLGVAGNVPSPTYTLLEEYRIDAARGASGGDRLQVVHLDLYRLGSDEELDMIGIRDWLERAEVWVLAEWLERASAFERAADLSIEIEITGVAQRRVTLRARSGRGRLALEAISDLVSK